MYISDATRASSRDRGATGDVGKVTGASRAPAASIESSFAKIHRPALATRRRAGDDRAR